MPLTVGANWRSGLSQAFRKLRKSLFHGIEISRRRAHVGVKLLHEFHAAPAYGGDLHRADMAWAKHATGRGLILEQIKDELLNGRDLKKKSNRKRQLEYAERTARKAIEQIP